MAAELEGDKVALLVVRRRLVLEFQGRESLGVRTSDRRRLDRRRKGPRRGVLTPDWLVTRLSCPQPWCARTPTPQSMGDGKWYLSNPERDPLRANSDLDLISGRGSTAGDAAGTYPVTAPQPVGSSRRFRLRHALRSFAALAAHRLRHQSPRVVSPLLSARLRSTSALTAPASAQGTRPVRRRGSSN